MFNLTIPKRNKTRESKNRLENSPKSVTYYYAIYWDRYHKYFVTRSYKSAEARTQGIGELNRFYNAAPYAYFTKTIKRGQGLGLFARLKNTILASP